TSGTTTTVLILNSGPITATNGNGIEAFGNATTGLVTVGTSGNRTSGNITATAVATSFGIVAQGFGDVSVYTAGNSTITDNSTAGGSWTIRARSIGNVAASPGGAVLVDNQATNVGLRGGIQAIARGLDATDSVTVLNSGAITANNGTAIDATSVNGNLFVRSE